MGETVNPYFVTLEKAAWLKQAYAQHKTVWILHAADTVQPLSMSVVQVNHKTGDPQTAT